MDNVSNLSNEKGPWTVHARNQAEYLLANGRPFDNPTGKGILVVGGCGLFSLSVPEDTREAIFEVSSSPVNTSKPGAGYGTLKVKHDQADRYRSPPEDDRPNETRSVSVDEPRSGEWLVWIWPWGPAVNQAYEVEVTLSGNGTAPNPTPTLEPGGFCAEESSPAVLPVSPAPG